MLSNGKNTMFACFIWMLTRKTARHDCAGVWSVRTSGPVPGLSARHAGKVLRHVLRTGHGNGRRPASGYFIIRDHVRIYLIIITTTDLYYFFIFLFTTIVLLHCRFVPAYVFVQVKVPINNVVTKPRFYLGLGFFSDLVGRACPLGSNPSSNLHRI